MKQRKDLILGAGLEIDQDVTAGNHIDPRKWRVGKQVLDRKHHRLAQLTHHAVAIALPQEKPGQALLAHLPGGLRSINSRPRKRDGMGVHVGREHLKLDIAL